MRNAFAQEMLYQAQTDEKVVLLSGDIGNRMFDTYKASYGERFYNCGVAEANMTGVAAGLALSGLKPVTYTITPFNTYRCYEQIRVDVCYQNLPVVIVGTGSGLSYASLGSTHHSCEDIAVLRALPNMTVMAPGDAPEVRACLRAALAHDGPVYIRIGKKNEPVVFEENHTVELGKAQCLRQGGEVALLNTGNTLPLAQGVTEALAASSIPASLYHFPTIKPMDYQALEAIVGAHKVCVSIEEHSLIGGFGGALAEWWVDNGITRSRLVRTGTPDMFLKRCGSQDNARDMAGLTCADIVGRITAVLNT